jgi:nitrate/nitrite transporter NarK
MTAVPLSGVIGGPISGWILSAMSHVEGLHGWQWLFVFEAIPSMLAGVLTTYFLDDGPAKAKWLTEDERSLLLRRLQEEEELKRAETPGHSSIADAFRSPQVWALCFVYFGLVMVNYGISFWLPQIVKDTLTKNVFDIGLLTAIPWAAAAIAMVLVGHNSDKTGERRWHIAIPAIVCAIAFALSALPGVPGSVGLLLLTFATAGVASAYSTFWALPATILSGTAASAGIAWVNSVGNLAGYLSPYLVGIIRDKAHSMFWALLMLSFCCLFSAVLTLLCFHPRTSHPRSSL